jgi:hypothetical protein
MPWNLEQPPLFQWANTIAKIVAAESLPDFDGPTVGIFTDDGGQHKGSQYHTTSVVYADMEKCRGWERSRVQLRQTHLPNSRRMSFKNLGDRHRRLALPIFLEATRRIFGVCVVVAVRKSIQDLCLGSESAGSLFVDAPLTAGWSVRGLESAVRVAHLIGLLLGGLSIRGQHVYWISDEDALFANGRTTSDVQKLLEMFTRYYVRHDLGELGMGTARIDEGDRFEEDYLSVADLAAGAMAEVLSRISLESGGRLRPGIAVPFSGSFSEKSEILCDWFMSREGALRKICVVIERLSPSQYAAFRWGVG